MGSVYKSKKKKETYRDLLLGEKVVLLAEQDLRLLGITQEYLQVEGLGQQGLLVLPHPLDILPAIIKGL